MPTLIQRAEIRQNIMTELERQIAEHDLQDKVEVILYEDGGEKSTGVKRQWLLEQAVGDYVCSIDDDDMVADTYLVDILGAMQTSPDVITFEGYMTTDGQNETHFVIRNDIQKWETKGGVFYRYPHHLCPIKREIAQKFAYADLTFGEDIDWANKVRKSLKTGVHIQKDLYFYLYRSNKVNLNKKQSARVIVKNTKMYVGENELHASRRTPTFKRIPKRIIR
jgi:glycosyltransferase involved in cell wall biosynthesis